MVPRGDLRAQGHESSRRRRCGGEKEGRAPFSCSFSPPSLPQGHTQSHQSFLLLPPQLWPCPSGENGGGGKKEGGKRGGLLFYTSLEKGGKRGGGGRRKELGFAFLPSSPPPSSGFTGFPEILLHFSCYTRYRSTFFVSFSFVPPFLRIMKKKHRRAGRKAYLTCRKRSKMNLPTCNKAPTSPSLSFA